MPKNPLTVLLRRTLHARSARRASIPAALLIGFAVICLIRSGVVLARSTPSVQTDNGVYVAGDTVIISGRDFSAGETVTVRVVHADGTAEPGMGHEPVDATVRPDGTFAATWVPANEDVAGPSLTVVTVGTVSGEIPPADFLRVADIGTDKADYYPGETVLISGRGFAPNELIKLQVVHANGQIEGGPGHDPFYATADAAGTVTASWFVNADAYGFQFRVIARGESSSVSGVATFWDAGPFFMNDLDVAYTENFDALAASGTANPWTDDSTLPGWFSQFTTTANPITYIADAGTSTTGGLHSYGTGASTERALGSIGSNAIAASGAVAIFNAARFVNNTGSTITSLDISYAGEQWRNGGNASAQPLDFQYQVANAGAITDANTPTVGWTDFNALDFVSPVTGTTAASLDGNVNRLLFSQSLAVTVAPGQEIWLRWVDTNDAGNDHALAIDDVSVTPRGGTTTPNLTINDVTLNEGNSGTTTFTFTVSLSSAAGAGGVTFDIATADDTATQPGDYTQNVLTAQTIPAGSTTYSFGVLVNGDTTPESNESFFVNVTNVSGASVVDGQGVGTIANDDAAPNLTITDVAASEGNSGTTTFAFTVSLSAPAPAGGVTFDIATADGTAQDDIPATEDHDYAAQALVSQTIPGGSSTYTFNVLVNGDSAAEPNETFFVNVANVTNAIGVDTQGIGTIVNDDTPKIHDIQGSGATFNATFGGTQTIEGIVVGAFTGTSSLNGFYVQEEDADADADASTSEGIFVFDPSHFFSGLAGDKVRVTGTVSEFATSSANIVGTGNSSLTELTAGSVTNLGAAPLPAVTAITLPVADTSDLERYEGMLVNVGSSSGPLVVTETFKLGRFGQVGLSGGGRLDQFTQFNPPSVPGYANYLANLQDNYIILDDASTTQNPDPVIHARGGNPLSATNTLRGGDTIASITGVLDHRFEGYRVQTTTAANFQPTNARQATPPAVGGALKVASGNLLNFFNGNGLGGGFPTSRGADNPTEFNRQKAKTIQELFALNADVFGYNEMENDGYGATSAIQELVDGLNAVAGAGAYTFIVPPASALTDGVFGSDEITVGVIYKPASVRVAPGTTPAALTTGIFTQGPGGVQRPVLAVTFERLSASAPTGQTFTVAINHWKSKGSAANLPGDADTGDGQGFSKATRTQAAQELTAWLATNPTGTTDPDYLILGDLNSYRLETPVTTLTSAGYSSLFGSESYSYQFNGQWGSLDHALVNASLLPQVTGAAKWHINSDEPTVLDYNTEFKSPGQIVSFYNVDPFRTSDHDPVVVGLFQVADLSIAKSDAPDPVIVGETLTYTLTVANNGPDDATEVTVTDTLPAGVAFVSATAGCVNSAGTVTCTVGALTNGATATMTITVTAPTTPGTISNTASVTGSPADPDGANNLATETTVVNPPAGTADLSIDKKGPLLAIVGNALTYSLKARNDGPNGATGVSVSDPLPAGVNYVSAVSTTGSCTFAAATRTVACAIGALASGQSATVTITVKPLQAGTLTNTATVSGTQSDPKMSNNSDTAVTFVLALADLSLTMTDSPDPVRVNNTLTYLLTVRNAGPSSASHVGLGDVLPEKTQFVSIVQSQGNCDRYRADDRDVVACDLGTLAPGATATVTIKVKPLRRGSITNRAATSSLAADPNFSNNSASATTTVNP
jgi:uncharacterized repeat protein (TIGR01451 family)